MTDKIRPDDVVRVALDLLGRGGLHALAMRRIASELGVQQSALYWHFDDKQHLLAAVADALVAPVEGPRRGAWQARIETLGSDLRRELLRFPDGAELVATTFAFRLGAQRPLRQFADELARCGLSLDDADMAARVLLHFILGHVTDEQQHQQAAALGAIEPPPTTEPDGTADERFGIGLRLIVAGIESLLGARSDG